MSETREDPRLGVAAAVREHNEAWSQATERFELAEGIGWRPDLRHSNGRLLHIAFQEIDEPWARRLRAAYAGGRKVAVALTPRALVLENLVLAQEVDAEVIAVDNSDEEAG